jgi:hypothetical protein
MHLPYRVSQNYFRKNELYNKMSLTKVSLLIILHFLAYSLFLCVNAFPWKRIFFKWQPSNFFPDYYSSFFSSNDLIFFSYALITKF